MSAPVLLFHNQGKGRPINQISYVNKILSSAPLAFWILDDVSMVVRDAVNGYHGIYIGSPVFGFPGNAGHTSVYFEGSGTAGNIYTSQLEANFNGAMTTLINSRFWKGAIQYVGLWATELTPTQIYEQIVFRR